MNSHDNQIHVSEERLKLLLAEFKLELFKELQQYATSSALHSVDMRLAAVERWQATQTGSQSKQELISVRMLAWSTLIVAIVGAVVYALVR